MKLKNILSMAAAAFVVITSCGSAMADLTVVQKVFVDYSKMRINGKPVTQDQLSAIKPLVGVNGSDAVASYSGKKAKLATTMYTAIYDMDANTATALMPTTKQYMKTPINSGMIAKMTAGMQTSTKDLGETKMILGHLTHLYKIFAKNQMMSCEGYAWVAPDINDTNAFQSVMQTQGGFSGVKGLALKTTVTVNITIMGSVVTSTTSTDVTSISTDPIPASTFDIPSDYKEMNMGAIMGNMMK